MSLEKEALTAIQSAELAESLVSSLSWIWWVLLIGVPIAAMIFYRYIIQNLVDRFILFLSNAQWTDEGKLIQLHGERWVIHEVGIFRVYLTKSVEIENRGRTEIMQKTLTISIPRYLASDVTYFTYKDLYSEKNLGKGHSELQAILDRLETLEGTKQ